MTLKYELLEDEHGNKGIKPYKATIESIGFDLALPFDVVLMPESIRTIPLLISFDLTYGHYLEIFPRSSIQAKQGIISSTSIIDPDYKDGIHAILYNTNKTEVVLKKGTRVVQAVYKITHWTELKEVVLISNNQPDKRGGLGSTGE